MIEFEEFERKAKEQGLNKPKEPLFWFFVTLVDRSNGAGAGGVFVQATHWMKAIDPVARMTVNNNLTLNEVVLMPDDKLPAGAFRNRLLTLDEVRVFWPWVKVTAPSLTSPARA